LFPVILAIILSRLKSYLSQYINLLATCTMQVANPGGRSGPEKWFAGERSSGSNPSSLLCRPSTTLRSTLRLIASGRVEGEVQREGGGDGEGPRDEEGGEGGDRGDGEGTREEDEDVVQQTGMRAPFIQLSRQYLLSERLELVVYPNRLDVEIFRNLLQHQFLFGVGQNMFIRELHLHEALAIFGVQV